MNKRILIIFTLLFPLALIAQDFSATWDSYFSYLNIKDVAKSNDKIYVAAESAVFTYNLNTNELETLTTVNGLSGENISAIHYSEAYQLLVIGYENGLIELFFIDDNNVLSVVDILDKPTIPPTSKKINHFEEYNEFLYISTNYGISVYDMSRLEFGDTYYIGSGGSQLIVNQTTIYGDYIYAACYNNGGIKRALVQSDNLIDDTEWQTITGAINIAAIESTPNGRIYSIHTNRWIYEIIGTTITQVLRLPNPILDFRNDGNNLLATTKNNSFLYNDSFTELVNIVVPTDYDTQFTTATIDEDYSYIGTKNFGVLKIAHQDQTDITEIHPDGPLYNYAFAIQNTTNNLWVTYGDYTFDFNPYPLRKRGFSHLNNETWVNKPYDSVLGARNLNKIAVNPFNTEQVFISSCFNGLIEVNNDSPTILFNETNSDLNSLTSPTNPNNKDLRITASSFDSQGVLWILNGRVEEPLVTYDPNSNQWNNYEFPGLISNGFADEFGFSSIVIDNNNTKWIGGFKLGLVGFNNNNGLELKNLNNEEHNMPSPSVSAIALDKRNQLWIGTLKGLRVVYNTSSFFTDPSAEAHSIIISNNGEAEELLFETYITDIEVDGSNNKWISTDGAGLYYFSADGQETIHHFTKDNSPIPSNSITDLSLQQDTGILYIATDRGIVSYSSGGSQTVENFEESFVYPNPVRPGFNMADKKIKIKGITDSMNIKITDIEGNLVAEAQSNTNLRYKGYNLEIDGGTAYWNGKNLANNTVASGVYLIMLSDLDSFETKVIKLMVVR
mgnify:CR=1 FL=1